MDSKPSTTTAPTMMGPPAPRPHWRSRVDPLTEEDALAFEDESPFAIQGVFRQGISLDSAPPTLLGAYLNTRGEGRSVGGGPCRWDVKIPGGGPKRDSPIHGMWFLPCIHADMSLDINNRVHIKGKSRTRISACLGVETENRRAGYIVADMAVQCFTGGPKPTPESPVPVTLTVGGKDTYWAPLLHKTLAGARFEAPLRLHGKHCIAHVHSNPFIVNCLSTQGMGGQDPFSALGGASGRSTPAPSESGASSPPRSVMHSSSATSLDLDLPVGPGDEEEDAEVSGLAPNGKGKDRPKAKGKRSRAAPEPKAGDFYYQLVVRIQVHPSGNRAAPGIVKQESAPLAPHATKPGKEGKKQLAVTVEKREQDDADRQSMEFQEMAPSPAAASSSSSAPPKRKRSKPHKGPFSWMGDVECPYTVYLVSDSFTMSGSTLQGAESEKLSANPSTNCFHSTKSEYVSDEHTARSMEVPLFYNALVAMGSCPAPSLDCMSAENERAENFRTEFLLFDSEQDVRMRDVARRGVERALKFAHAGGVRWSQEALRGLAAEYTSSPFLFANALPPKWVQLLQGVAEFLDIKGVRGAKAAILDVVRRAQEGEEPVPDFANEDDPFMKAMRATLVNTDDLLSVEQAGVGQRIPDEDGGSEERSPSPEPDPGRLSPEPEQPPPKRRRAEAEAAATATAAPLHQQGTWRYDPARQSVVREFAPAAQTPNPNLP